jgi:hypothetical protein
MFNVICLTNTLLVFYPNVASQLDTAIFVSQDSELTARVLVYLNALPRTKRIIKSMALNMPAEYFALSDKLFVIRSKAELSPSLAGHILDMIHIDGLVNGELTVAQQQEYHNTYFSETDLREIRLELGGVIV